MSCCPILLFFSSHGSLYLVVLIFLSFCRTWSKGVAFVLPVQLGKMRPPLPLNKPKVLILAHIPKGRPPCKPWRTGVCDKKLSHPISGCIYVNACCHLVTNLQIFLHRKYRRQAGMFLCDVGFGENSQNRFEAEILRTMRYIKHSCSLASL